MDSKEQSDIAVQLALMNERQADLSLIKRVVVGDGNGNPGLIRRLDSLEEHMKHALDELSGRVEALEQVGEERRGDRKKLMWLLAGGAISFAFLALAVWLGIG